jgi:hypothetical protein
MDGLHTRLDRDTFVAGERGHRGSAAGTNDASCCVIMEKMSPQNCSQGGPSGETYDLTIRATIVGVSVGQSTQGQITFEFGEFLMSPPSNPHAGCICAAQTEYGVACELLDEEYPNLPSSSAIRW